VTQPAADARTGDARYDVIGPGHTAGSVTDKISEIVLTRKTPKGWWIGFGISFLLMNLLFVAVAHLLITGIGIWGVNIPVAWGFAIINFVWWIGIGHAGTLISAILLLLGRGWSRSAKPVSCSRPSSCCYTSAGPLRSTVSLKR
jgi:hypothetical protein